MPSLPVLLKDPRILLLGGGTVALQKAQVLLDNQICFSVIAKELCSEFESLLVSVTLKSLERKDLTPFQIIVDATGNDAVGALLAEEKRCRSILVNRVDQPQQCDFYFSSLLNYGRLKIAVSTDGASPVIGQEVRNKIKQVIPSQISDLVEEKALQRKVGKIDAHKTRQQIRTMLAQVSLVGCGPGDVHLLTLQAYHCIQHVDVVLYDHLISEEILSLIPVDTKKVYVGKRKGAHSFKQEQINALLLDYAKQGVRIARLKSGDPYIFGRGAEEARFLVEHGIQVEVVSGLSSALVGPATAGIPLTARGFAANMSIVSAHLSGSRINSAWLPLLKLEYHTTVVLMGLSFAEQITQLALKEGVDPELPVAIVSNASRPSQQTIVTTLSKMPEAAMRAERPAVLVFGPVVELHHILPGFISQS